jgi:small GTP-binding protein
MSSLKVVCIGSVDSGKTTFFKKITGRPIIEEGSRTQGIRSSRVQLKKNELILLDCPGHISLEKFRQVAYNCADFVILFVDASRVDLEMLQSIEKPVVVVFNKIDQVPNLAYTKDLNLKSLLEDNKKKNEFYVNFDSLLKSTPTCSSFLEADLTKKICFPMSLKYNFGFQQFISFLDNFYLKNYSTKKECSYMYAVKSTSKGNDFKTLDSPELDYYLVLNKKEYPLTTFFSYVKSKQVYTSKEQTPADLKEASILRLYTKYELKTNSFCDSYVTLIQFPTLYELPVTLREALKNKQLYQKDLNIWVYSEDPNKKASITNYLKRCDLKVIQVDIPPFKISRIKNKNDLYLCWGGVPQIEDEKNNIWACTSFYKLISILQQKIVHLKKKRIDQVCEQFQKEGIFRILPNYVFQQDKNFCLVGCTHKYGVIHKGSKVKMYDKKRNSIQLKINSIGHNKTNVKKMDLIGTEYAIKLEGPCEQMLKDKYFFGYSLGLEDKISAYDQKQAEIPELKRILEIQNQFTNQ